MKKPPQFPVGNFQEGDKQNLQNTNCAFPQGSGIHWCAARPTQATVGQTKDETWLYVQSGRFPVSDNGPMFMHCRHHAPPNFAESDRTEYQ